MPQFNYTIEGIEEFKRVIKKNPARTIVHLKTFFVRAIAEYRRTIMQSPWRVRARRGGAPVKSGNLKASHQTIISPLRATIGPNRAISLREVSPGKTYADYVHDGTPGGRMKPRPWLDYAFSAKKTRVKNLSKDLLKKITADLAK